MYRSFGVATEKAQSARLFIRNVPQRAPPGVSSRRAWEREERDPAERSGDEAEVSEQRSLAGKAPGL